MAYNHNIEDWWRHLGCWDRESVSGISYLDNRDNMLDITDSWWNRLSAEEKGNVYEEFFDEN